MKCVQLFVDEQRKQLLPWEEPRHRGLLYGRAGKARLLSISVCHQRERLMMMTKQAVQEIHQVSAGQFLALHRTDGSLCTQSP